MRHVIGLSASAAGALALLAAALGAAGCGGSGGGSGDDGGGVYIAQQSNFADFQSWHEVALGNAPLAGHPPGHRFGYVNKAAPAGATKYPVGTLIVKTVVPDDPNTTQQQWDLFGMVKRGGGFNAEGATDWEFFIFKINPQGVPVIVSRGINPSDTDSGGYGGGGGSDMGSGIACNSCHGVSGSERTDHILSPLLQPGK